MSRKSASRVKPMEPKPEERPLQELFEESRDIMAAIVDVQVVTAQRVDNLMNIRDYARKFWSGDRKVELGYIKSLQELSVETYRKVAEMFRSFKLEDFIGEEVHDFVGELVPKVGDIETEDELCRAGLVYLSVKPYGEKMLQLHQVTRDEYVKRSGQE